MSIEVADRHAAYAERLIQQAIYELEKKGDRLQATEKASGAAAHAVKAIAEDRLWRHGSHNLRRTIVDLLAVEFHRPDLAEVQYMADRLHDNYYEDRLHDWQIQERLARVTDLVQFLVEARQQGPNPDFVPTTEQQRTIERLQLSEEEAAADPLIDYPPQLPPFIPPDE